jgi:predicted CopG family antitoxin
MVAMTLINVHVKEEEKKKLQKYVGETGGESMSEVIRTLIHDKIAVDTLITRLPTTEDVEIPTYVPKDKYVIFVNGAIVGVGDDPSELAEQAMHKFPNLPFVMKFNGEPMRSQEYVFMSLTATSAWRYSRFGDRTYPMLPVQLVVKREKQSATKTFFASIDTAASLCIVKAGSIPNEACTSTRKEQVATAGGIVDMTVYAGIVSVLDTTFEVEFIFSPIPNTMPFTFLIGRNLLDHLDAYFLGKKQVLLLKIAEP